MLHLQPETQGMFGYLIHNHHHGHTRPGAGDVTLLFSKYGDVIANPWVKGRHGKTVRGD